MFETQKNHTGIFPVILAVCILVAIAGVGVYVLSREKPPATQGDDAPLQTQTANPVPTQSGGVESSAEVSPTPKIQPKAGWKVYSDTRYGYTLQYPAGWTLKQEADSEGDARIKLTSNRATKAAFSPRMLPEVYITVAGPYSTSGALCANQFCTETPPPLEISVKGQDLVIPVIKGEVLKSSVRQLDYYAFSFPLPGKKVTLQGYTEPVSLNVVASYRTAAEAETISGILSTITY